MIKDAKLFAVQPLVLTLITLVTLVLTLITPKTMAPTLITPNNPALVRDPRSGFAFVRLCGAFYSVPYSRRRRSLPFASKVDPSPPPPPHPIASTSCLHGPDVEIARLCTGKRKLHVYDYLKDAVGDPLVVVRRGAPCS